MNGSGLGDCDASVLCGHVGHAATPAGRVDRRAFGGVLDAFATSPSRAAPHAPLLHYLYGAFVRDEQLGADAAEVAAGLSLLCAGSKSAKLAVAWELFDGDKWDGALSRRGLWRYLRSFLAARRPSGKSRAVQTARRTFETAPTLRRGAATRPRNIHVSPRRRRRDPSEYPRVAPRRRRDPPSTTTAFDECAETVLARPRSGRRPQVLLAVASLPDGEDDVADIVVDVVDDADDAAVALAATIFEETGCDDLIAFDDFADWYTEGGFRVASWLELLDLTKWVL